MAHTSSAALDTFHPFPRLSKELSVEIWKLGLAAREPRLLIVQECYKVKSVDVERDLQRWERDHSPGYIKETQHFSSPTPVTALLQVCRESRKEALNHYTRAFTGGIDPRYVWTDFELDIIKMDAYDLPMISDEDRRRIQHMSVDVSYGDYFWESCQGEFDIMGELKDLEVVSPDPLHTWGGMVKGLKERFLEDFGALPGYVPPEIRFRQTGSSVEMTIHNFQDIMNEWRTQCSLARGGRGRGGRWARGMGRGRGRGVEDGV